MPFAWVSLFLVTEMKRLCHNIKTELHYSELSNKLSEENSLYFFQTDLNNVCLGYFLWSVVGEFLFKVLSEGSSKQMKTLKKYKFYSMIYSVIL